MSVIVVFFLSLGFISLMMFRMTLGIPLPSIMSEFSINEVHAGLLLSAPLWSLTILLIPSGYLADRFGQKRLLLSGYLLLSLGVFLVGLSPTYVGCLVSLIIAGVGAGILQPSYFTIMGEILTKVRGLAIGFATGIGNLGGLIGSVLMGLFVVQQQWRLAYIILGIIIFVITVIQFIVIRFSFTQSKNEVELNNHTSFRKLMKTRNILIISSSMFFAGTVFSTSITWLPTFLHSYIELDTVSVSLVFGFFTLVGVVSSPILGIISDRIGRSLLISISGITSAAISIPMFITKYAFWSSVGYLLTFGFLVFPAYNLLITFAQESTNKNSMTTVTGLVVAFAFLGTAIAPVITGILIPVYGISQALIYTITVPTLIYSFAILAAIEKRGK